MQFCFSQDVGPCIQNIRSHTDVELAGTAQNTDPPVWREDWPKLCGTPQLHDFNKGRQVNRWVKQLEWRCQAGYSGSYEYDCGPQAEACSASQEHMSSLWWNRCGSHARWRVGAVVRWWLFWLTWFDMTGFSRRCTKRFVFDMRPRQLGNFPSQEENLMDFRNVNVVMVLARDVCKFH